MNIAVITGSRADYGHLEWPMKLMREDEFFTVAEVRIWGMSAAQALDAVDRYLANATPDLVMLLGDRFEILSAAIACHLRRVPIAHLAGGDITEGSYDDAMRDCVSRLAKYHFATSPAAAYRLNALGYINVHDVGSTTHDYILNADWRRNPPYLEPYVVVSYQAETARNVSDIRPIYELIGDRKPIIFLPNRDLGSDVIAWNIRQFAHNNPAAVVLESVPHDEFLNLLAHCDEFIGNSSAILYEAPLLGCRTRLIGTRQHGRVAPAPGDGKASDRIIEILKKEFADGPRAA